MQPIDLIPNKEERWTACVPLPLLLLRYKHEIKRKKKRFFMAYEIEEFDVRAHRRLERQQSTKTKEDGLC